MLLKIAIVAGVVWWLFFRKKAHAATGVIQPEGQPDFDPVTAEQLTAVAKGDVTVGDEWSATFVEGNGNWNDVYRTHAAEDRLLLGEAAALSGGDI